MILLNKTFQHVYNRLRCLSQDLKEVPETHDTSARRSRGLRQERFEVDCHFALLTMRGSNKCLNGTMKRTQNN